MRSTSETLAFATAHHQAGRLAEAESMYRQIVASAPDWAEAWHLWGLIAYQTGRFELAIEIISKAVALRPDYGEALSNLGVVFKALNRLDEAEACHNRALALEPNAAETINNLGTVFQARGRSDEAISLYQRAIELKPGYAEAHNNLGLALVELEKVDEALNCYQRAIQAFPSYAEAYNNLGHAMHLLGRPEEAAIWFERALIINSHFALAYNNLGVSLQQQGKFDEAEDSFRHALALEPDFAAAHVSLSFLMLLKGDLVHGWPEFEWRWRYKGFRGRAPSRPSWEGSSLAGRTMLLHTEQGFGDAFQFVRYVPLVKQLGAKVILHAPTTLKRLLETCPGVDQVVGDDELVPTFDEHASVLSLPGIFKNALPTIPANVPYLSADPKLIEAWEAKLRAFGGFRIGINWQGRKGLGDFRLRDLPLSVFRSLGQLPGVSLISLQKGGQKEIAEAAEWLDIVDLGEFDTAHGAFMDTAAIMKNLDLIITSDTAVPHVAGALGVPVWLALPHVPNWRWLLDRADSPWYPTMRLFRQKKPGDWTAVFEEIRAALIERIGPGRSA